MRLYLIVIIVQILIYAFFKIYIDIKKLHIYYFYFVILAPHLSNLHTFYFTNSLSGVYSH